MVSWLQIKLESLFNLPFRYVARGLSVFDLKMSFSSRRLFRFCSCWRWREGQEGLHVENHLTWAKCSTVIDSFCLKLTHLKITKQCEITDTWLRSSRFLLLDPREHTSRVLQVCFDQALISYSRWKHGGPKMFIQHDAPGQWLVSMWQSQNFTGQNFTKFEVKSFQVKNETPKLAMEQGLLFS